MSIAVLEPESTAPITTLGTGWTILEGNPTVSTWFEYKSADGSIVAGTWRASQGTFRAEYSFYEFVHMLEGRIEITPDGGKTVTVGPGSVFSVEANFKGVWKIIEPVRKRFLLKLK